MKVVDNGKIRESQDVLLADKLIHIRKKGDPWQVIDLLVKVWAQRAPDEERAMKVQVQEYRDMLADKRFGQTVGGKDFERRFTIAFPQMLMLMLRTQYKAQELPTDSKFYKEFARRYPEFKVAENTT